MKIVLYQKEHSFSFSFHSSMALFLFVFDVQMEKNNNILQCFHFGNVLCNVFLQGHDGWIEDIDVDEYSKRIVSCGKVDIFRIDQNVLDLYMTLFMGRHAVLRNFFLHIFIHNF